ncbi:hypothetical protein CTAYLR_001632 [Chrysophaeum taylorii]|uniref:lysozyme n=1 Tax=Chrysophaeum taylorii TaxID=2483200 RepID=A0AAD7XL18_9STRA|nr:hypothetical protein CTAYLR_001632 [Chrysophaeum taylorii]
MDLLRAIFNVILVIESNDDENVRDGDGGKAIGPAQIWRSYHKDAKEVDSSIGDYAECKGPGSREESFKVFVAYMKRYATKARLKREPSVEDIVRIHNGGPNGFEKEATLPYYDKFLKAGGGEL